MAKLTRNQRLVYSNIHFHLVDIRNTIKDTRYSKEDCLKLIELLVKFVERIMEE